MNYAVLNSDVQDFISNNLDKDISRILFGKSPFAGISSRELAEQIESKKRCEKKLPSWYHTPGIYFPEKLAIEQASSEITARYKSELITGSLADLTGGFGVDSHYFAQRAKQVTHVELNTGLSELAKHNASVLGDTNIRFVNGDGMAYLQSNTEDFDTIFIDPSRRVNNRKVFFLKDCEPDVVSNLELLLKKTRRILIKTSPLLDIQSGLSELRHVSQVHILSYKNECRELIWVIDRDFEGEPELFCSALNSELPVFHFFSSQEQSQEAGAFSTPLSYLYEPDAALMKAGCFKLIPKHWNISKLHQHSHFYTSETKIEGFMGRTFRVKQTMDYKEFSKANTVKKANVIARNFPLTVDNIRKKHRIEDGGDVYLIFSKTSPERLIVVVGERGSE